MASIESALRGFEIGRQVEIRAAYWRETGEEMDELGGCAGYILEVSGNDVKVEMLNGDEVWLTATRVRL